MASLLKKGTAWERTSNRKKNKEGTRDAHFEYRLLKKDEKENRNVLMLIKVGGDIGGRE